MPFGPIEARLNAIEHRLADAAGSLRDAARRLAAVEQSSDDEARASAAGGGSIYEGYGTTSHTLEVYGACWGNPALDDADIYVFVPVPKPGSPGYATLTFSHQVTTVGGFAVVQVPTYDTTLLEYGTGLAAVPYARIGKFSYDLGRVTLPQAGPFDHVVILKPAVGYGLAPSVRVIGSGSGAQFNGSLGLVAPGTGYGLDTTLSLLGGYDTGGAYDAIEGRLVSASPGTNFQSWCASTFPVGGGTVTFASGSTAAVISAAPSNGGYPSWTISNGGSGYPKSSHVPIASPTAPAFGSAPVLRGIADGSGQLTGVQVLDPGYRNTTNPRTITLAKYGSGASIAIGKVGSTYLITGTTPGSGYTDAPVPSPSGAASAIDYSFDATAVAGSALARNGDRWGCWGQLSRPARLTGPLSCAHGTLDLGDLNSLCPLGSLWDTATDPPLNATGYYSYNYAWQRGGYLVFTPTFSGGHLVGVTLVDGGYGYPGVGLSVTLIPGTMRRTSGVVDSFSVTGTDYAVFRFALDGSGTCVGSAIIDNPGSGYGGTAGFAWAGPEPQGGEWELLIQGSLATSGGVTRPSSTRVGKPLFQVFGESLTVSGVTTPWPLWSQVTASYQLARKRGTVDTSSGSLVATFDFTGTAADGTIFQGGASRVVTYSEV